MVTLAFKRRQLGNAVSQTVKGLSFEISTTSE